MREHVTKWSEQTLQDACTENNDALFRSLDPQCPLVWEGKRQVKLGNFKIDYLARNRDGGLTIVEFKICAKNDTLAQLLLYPRAITVGLKKQGCPDRLLPKTKIVLVSTFLDKGVVELARRIRPPVPIGFRLCVEKNGGPMLVDPSEDGHEYPGQFWDQATENPEKQRVAKSQIEWRNGALSVKGENF
ncbi:MAG: hypothetical protein HY897_08335 [Deltaproteobacteria bacterium]|nr:hypothetical protein [Deltaproteobacteria bacterium]